MSKSDANDRFVRRTAVSLAPILLWAVHFGLVYGGAHVACTTSDGPIGELGADIAVWGVTGAVVLALVGVGLRVRSLLSGGAGGWLLIIGSGLVCCGLLWSDRITASVSR